jgi:excisionase family DNA binding protein
VAERLLTASELAQVLGMSAATVIDWAAAGRVPSFKLGHAVRFRESEVLDWLEQHRRGPRPEPCYRVSDTTHV